MGSKTEEPRPLAIEAKEALRKAAIGKRVKVHVDGSRKVKRGETEVELKMATICTEEGLNFAVLVLERGLAEFSHPRPGDPVSKALSDLEAARSRGEKIKHKPSANKQLWDFTKMENRKKIREFALDQFKNKRDLQGVVEAILSGSRVKLRFEEAGCFVAFAMDGVRCLEKNPNMPDHEKWAKKAIEYTRSRINQRDVAFELESIDKGGSLHGQLLF